MGDGDAAAKLLYKGEKMKETYKKITVDLSRKSNSRLIFARQNDVGARNLLIALTNGGASYLPETDNSVSLNFKRSDGVSGAVAAMIGRLGEIIVTIPQIALGAVGETVCSVSLYDSKNNKLTSSDFYIDVTEEYYSGENIEDSPEYSLLQSVFTEVAKINTAEENRVAAENVRASNEKSRIAAEAKRDEQLVKNLGFGGTCTVQAGKWVGKAQKVSVPDLGEDDLIIFYPMTRADRGIIANCGVFIEPQVSGGEIRFTVAEEPSLDLTLSYFITKGRAVE